MGTIVQQTNGEKTIYTADEYTLVQKQLASINQQLGTLATETNLESLQTSVNTNTSNISTLQTDVSNNTSQLVDIATDIVRSFGADPTGVNDSTTAVQNALNSNNTLIYFPPGTYKITGTINVNAGTVKKMFGTRYTTFSIQLPTSSVLFHFYRNVEIENFVFDFNNGFVSTGISYEENLGKIRLHTITFQNVKDTDNTTGTTIINIANYGNVMDVDGLEFINMYKKGNGVVTDSNGNITAFLLQDRTNTGPNNGVIKNIRITEMHNIDSNGNIINEDTSGVYLYSAYTGNDGYLLLENVYGYNFGKRLIKIDSQSINIQSVYGFSNKIDSYTGIGLLDTSATYFKQKINISDVQLFGLMQIGIAVGVSNVNINNVIIDIQRPSGDSSTEAWGIDLLTSNQVTINNAVITAGRCIFLSRTDAIFKNIKVSNSMLTVPSWGFYPLQLNNSSYGFQNITIQNVTAVSYSLTNSTSAFLDTTGLSGTSANSKGKGLNIINCTMTYLATTGSHYGLNIKNVDDVTITNYTYNNDGVTQAYEGMQIDTCKNVGIINYACNAYTVMGIKLLNSDNVKIHDTSSPNANYILSSSNSTNIRLKGVDKTKVLLSDATTQQGTLIEADSSYSTTANRPLVAFVGNSHFDTTLNKPIYCKTTGNKEVDTLTISTGATTSGNITITLNGVSTTVAVLASDSAGAIGDKIRNTSFQHWIVGGTTGSSTVTFTKTIGGTNTAPTFADTSTTGTSASFSVTTAGTNPSWVDATGAAV